MKKFCLLFVIFVPLYLLSQEIDQSYLDSLPEDMRQDILDRIDEKKGDETPVYYRSIDSSSDIPKNINKLDEINIFGSDFFQTMQTSFMPINLPNLDDSYILDFGDILNIQLVGKVDLDETYSISRDGSINLPDIGKLYLAGLSLDKASALIDSKVKQTFIGVDSYTTLTGIRDVSVLVSGDAYIPGVYTLNGNSNMLHALSVAGGIGEYGSFRSVKLIRGSQVIEVLDVYDILIKGDYSFKNRLRSGDIIFVDPRQKVVLMEGAFKRPRAYELKENQSLYDAINYANGLSTNADLTNIFLYRPLDGEVKSIPITNISQFKNITPNDEDRIFIRKYPYRNIEISGAIMRPGNYKMKEGSNILDLIEDAGGYSQNAYPLGAIYINEEAKTLEQNANKKLYKEFVDSLLAILQNNSSGAGIDASPIIAIANELKNSTASGRVVVDLEDQINPVLIRHKDSIYIPEKNNNVYVFGEVSNTGAMIYKKGADINFYLNEASGPKNTADKSSIYIVHPNGRTVKFSKKRNIFASQPNKNIEIYPGSIIYVPRKIDNSLSNRLTAQAYATILGNLGVTIASLSVLNDK